MLFAKPVTSKLTLFVSKPTRAATPKVLNNMDPMIVPRPISESTTNVLIVLVKNSGIEVAVAIKVAAATS